MSLEGVECVRVKAEPPWEYTELEQPEAQATLTYTVKVEPQCPQSESEVACGVSDASLQLKHEVKEEIEIEVGPEEFHQSKVCRLLPRELASLYTHEQSGTLMAEVKTEPEDDICDSKTHASLYKVHESAQTRHVDYMVKVEDACGVSAARTGEDELVGPEECQKPKEILMSPGPIQREDRRTKQGSKSLRISKKRKRKHEETAQPDSQFSILRKTLIHGKSADENPYKCNYCNYSSTNKNHVKNHIVTHTGEKPYKCDYCTYTCARTGDLNRHMKIHTGDTFKCDYCTYACASKRLLKQHLFTHGDKPYKCKHCNYAANNASNYNNHMLIHTGEKSHQCSYCSYSTSRRTDLICHIRIHVGLKPYKCDQCGYANAKLGNLRHHMKIHTGDTPHKCEHCGYATAYKSNLKAHMKRVHKNYLPSSE
ncbi:zinc finger protein 761-like isoform X1 [Cydia pomonella]|uniref:zinc finger protein 761-like isoform X1 n=1 Tax=Cydia pomonella TaxID=82600 RepID=UPI002ADE57F7|nr:zinc finger protein 761-like isoform X1 [Cydia pomonella]